MAKKDYDIANPPAPPEWLAMEEEERVAAVEEAHRRTRSPVGQHPAAHASMHVVVENRLAMGHAVVVAAYERFRAAGIDRHTTVHALASVVSRHMMAILERTAPDQEAADLEFAALDPAAWQKKKKR